MGGPAAGAAVAAGAVNQSLPAAPVSGMRFRCRWAHRVRAVKLAGTGRQLSCHALCHQVVRVPAITCTVSCWTSGAWRWVPLALAAHLGSRIPLPLCPGVLTCRPQHKKKLLPALGTVQWGLWRMLAACRHCFCGTAGCPARLPAGARMCSQGVVVWAGAGRLGTAACVGGSAGVIAIPLPHRCPTGLISTGTTCCVCAEAQ